MARAATPFAMQAPAGITVSGLSKTFRGRGQVVQARWDVTLSSPPGSFTALIGPSRCGKSTVLRAALGLEPLDAGRAEIGGQTPAQATKAGVTGVAFQNAGLLPWRSVARNTALPLARLLFVLSPVAERVARGVNIAIFMLPPIAPILTLTLDGMTPRIVLAALGVYCVTLQATVTGLRQFDSRAAADGGRA